MPRVVQPRLVVLCLCQRGSFHSASFLVLLKMDFCAWPEKRDRASAATVRACNGLRTLSPFFRCLTIRIRIRIRLKKRRDTQRIP